MTSCSKQAKKKCLLQSTDTSFARATDSATTATVARATAVVAVAVVVVLQCLNM